MQKYLLIILIALLGLGGTTSCKSKKKAAERAAMEASAQLISKTKNELQSLLANNEMSPEEMERELNRIKALNIDDPEVKALIKKAEDKIASAKAERTRKEAELQKQREEEERLRREREAKSATIQELFTQITGAGSTEQANRAIQQALQLFASPDVPVLISIGVFDGEKDYDKPTTIGRYLDYLKDQKKQIHRIDEVKKDANGKIIELELMTIK